MFFTDKLTLDRARRTSDGFMAIRARAARSGVYQYLGREVDPEGKRFTADQVVNVYRPADEVFKRESVASFVGKPITDDHPSEAVNSGNWRDLARGTIMGAARDTLEDGDFVSFDLAFMDAATIAKVDAGKKELSNGYDCELEFADGVAPDGTEYQAIQRNIRGNHVALVDAGRAGSQCSIGDGFTCEPIPSDAVRKMLCDERTYELERDRAKNGRDENGNLTGDHAMPKILTIDGLKVDISNVDTAESTITSLMDKAGAAAKRADEAEAEVAKLTTDMAAKDAEIETLKAKLEDTKISPADMRAAAKSYADAVAKAKALGVTVADDADEPQIRRAVVDAKLGDKAKDWTDAQVDASFEALTADVKPGSKPGQQQDRLSTAISSSVTPISDAASFNDAARKQALARKESAYLKGGAA